MNGDVEARLEKNRVKKLLFERQGGLCFYCDRPTWLPSEGVKKGAARLGLPVEGHGWRKTTRKRMATLEHLHRRADGGPDQIENYAVACRSCNGSRDDRKVEDHREAMIAAFQKS
jgi:5-methylcytosine-specific restriction endonuclease McrA